MLVATIKFLLKITLMLCLFLLGGKSELDRTIPILQKVIKKAEICTVRDQDELLDEKA